MKTSLLHIITCVLCEKENIRMKIPRVLADALVEAVPRHEANYLVQKVGND